MNSPAASGPRNRRRGGFTLLEIVVVVLIIGIMVALAISKLDFMVPKYRLRGAARDVASILKQGKARAAAQGRDCYFEVDLSQGRYWLLAPFPKEDPSQDPRQVDPRAVEYQPVFLRSLPEGVHFVDAIQGDKEKSTSGLVRLRLSAFGAASHLILNLVNGAESVLAVKMNGFTGMVSFLDGYQDAGEILEDHGT